MTDDSTNPTRWERLIASLRERRLLPATLGYLAAGAVAIEMTDLLGSQFSWSPAVLPTVIGLVGLGFFLALTLTWFHGAPGQQRVTRGELAVLGLILVIGVPLVVTIGRGGGAETPPSAEATQSDARALARRSPLHEHGHRRRGRASAAGCARPDCGAAFQDRGHSRAVAGRGHAVRKRAVRPALPWQKSWAPTTRSRGACCAVVIGSASASS